MKKLTKPALMVVTFLFLFAAVNGADDPKKSGSEKAAAKKDGKAESKKEGEAKKERATSLPQHYNQIGLSDDQKEKVRSIAEKYDAQIDELQKKITDLKASRDTEQHALLNDNQKKSLESLIATAKSKGQTTAKRGDREQLGKKGLSGVGKKLQEKKSEEKKAEPKK